MQRDDVQFGNTADDYRTYRAGFPASLFERLSARNVIGEGQVALDLGTGTGTMARGMARHGAQVTGLDVSRELTAAAMEIDQEEGLEISYVNRPAEQTGFEDESFDLVSAGQAWHWFDRRVTAQEVRRVLKPGGTLVIAHFDWLPLAGNVVAATESLIEIYNPQWEMGGGTGIYGEWLRDVGLAGFSDIETFTYDEPVVYSHEAWRGRIRASAGVGASLSPQEVHAFDRDFAHLLSTNFPGDPLRVPHRVFCLTCTSQ